MIISATGHRLGPRVGGYERHHAWRMQHIAHSALSLLRPERVLSGMALGWDQAVADSAYRLGIPWVAVIPFVGQEKRWYREDQMLYRKLLEVADETVVVSGTTTNVGWAMRMRNQYLTDHCDTLLALWDGGAGGTANCLEQARRYGARRTVINLWPVWCAP